MKRILVTGAAGQLGAELCRLLGQAAVPIDIDKLDLTHGSAVRKALAEIQPELVINCAAYTQVDQAESEPGVCRAVNAVAVEYLVEACRGLDCPLVQISTDYVFGAAADPPHPHREDDPTLPQGVYAQTKLEGEWAAAKHPKHLIVRTCGLYARPSHQEAQNFVKTILRFARSSDKLRVVADQHCTPSYVPHVARAVLFLAGVDRAGPGALGNLSRHQSRRDHLARAGLRDRPPGRAQGDGRGHHHSRISAGRPPARLQRPGHDGLSSPGRARHARLESSHRRILRGVKIVPKIMGKNCRVGRAQRAPPSGFRGLWRGPLRSTHPTGFSRS